MEINRLKIEYLLRISWPDSNSKDTGIGQLDAFLSDSFSALRVARSLNDCDGRDLYFLVVLALLRKLLEQNESHQKNLLFMQIISLLESSNETESVDRQILLLLSRLYNCLGLGTALICTYRKLRIKDILNEPLAHVLYTRMSLNHPFSISAFDFGLLEEYNRDPSLGASRVIDKYASAIETVNKLIADTHKTPVYNRMSEYMLLKRNLNGSRTKQIVVLERRRMSRLRGEQCDEDDLHELGTFFIAHKFRVPAD